MPRRYSLRARMLLVNLCVTSGALLLCAAVFVLSIWLVVGQYIDRDIDFFLAELSNNLSTRLHCVENIVIDVLEQETLTDFLAGKSVEPEQLQLAIKKASDLADPQNLSANRIPLVEKAYLFSMQGDYVRSTYYAQLYAEQTNTDALFVSIHALFAQNAHGNDYVYYTDVDEQTYLAFALYDSNIDRIGTLIMELRTDAIEATLEATKQYPKAISLVYDTMSTDSLYTYNAELLTASDWKQITQEWHYEPYKTALEGGAYRIYTREMPMNLRVSIGIPVNQLSIIMRSSVRIYVFILIAITLATMLVYFFAVYWLTKPLQEVTEKLHMVRAGDFKSKLPDYDTIEFHEISRVFNDMTANIDHLIKQVYEKQLTVQEMELKLFRSRINPHFMFNVLNTIALQAKLDHNEEIYRMISSFSQLIQSRIYRNESELVPLGQELEYVEYYLYLQSYRYGDRLRYAIEVEEESLRECIIPKLSLQMLVENAVVHGIEPKAEISAIEVKVRRNEATVQVEISDNGVGFEVNGEILLPLQDEHGDEAHNHIGLNNIHHIIHLMYGDAYGLQVFSQKGKGCKVIMRVPIERKERADA